jgi:hypothetical protein
MGNQFKILDDIILWHMAQCKYAMWHFKMNLIQDINIRMVGTSVLRCPQT